MTEHTLKSLADFVWSMETKDIQEERIAKFILQDEEGGIIVAITPFGDEHQKDLIIAMLAKRVVTEKLNIVRYVMASEAWRSTQKLSDGPHFLVPPSEDPAREEILMLIGVDRNGETVTRQAPIFTDKDGTRSLGEAEDYADGTHKGRMASLFQRIDEARLALH